jgi:phosphonopyruvate decarboxylase
MFVSGRGVEVEDEPQHQRMGEITADVIEACGASMWTLCDELAGFEDQLAEASASMRASGLPAVFVARKATIETFATVPTFDHLPSLSRPDVLRATAEALPTDAILLATTGKLARELFAIDDRSRNFYCMGSMGHVAAIGLGVAIAQPRRKVVVLDGDGSAIMHLGVMSTVGGTQPENLVHVVVDNRTYESTGNQLTTAPNTDFRAVALACGYANACRVETRDAYVRALAAALAAPGPACIHARVNLEVLDAVPRITTRHSAPEVHEYFAEFLARSRESVDG